MSRQRFLVVFFVVVAIAAIVGAALPPAAEAWNGMCGNAVIAMRTFYGSDRNVRAANWATAQLRIRTNDCGVRTSYGRTRTEVYIIGNR